MALLSETRQRKSTSRSLALAHGYIWWKIPVSTVVGKTLQWSWLFLFVADWRKLPDYQKVRKLSNATSKKLRRMVEVPHRRQYHPVNVRQPKKALSENKMWRTPCWIRYNLPQLRHLWVTLSMKLSKNNLLMTYFPRLSSMRWRDTLTKDIKSKEGIIGTQPRRNHIHSRSERPQVWGFVRRQKQHEPRWWDKTWQARERDCTFHEIRRLDHSRSQNSEQDKLKTQKTFWRRILNHAIPRIRFRVIRWIPKEASETMLRVYRDFFIRPRTQKSFTQTISKNIEACQD